MLSELITSDELAERLRLKPATIRLWTREGVIPAVRVGGKVVRYDFLEVVAALRKISPKQAISRAMR